MERRARQDLGRTDRPESGRVLDGTGEIVGLRLGTALADGRCACRRANTAMPPRRMSLAARRTRCCIGSWRRTSRRSLPRPARATSRARGFRPTWRTSFGQSPSAACHRWASFASAASAVVTRSCARFLAGRELPALPAPRAAWRTSPLACATCSRLSLFASGRCRSPSPCGVSSLRTEISSRPFTAASSASSLRRSAHQPQSPGVMPPSPSCRGLIPRWDSTRTCISPAWTVSTQSAQMAPSSSTTLGHPPQPRSRPSTSCCTARFAASSCAAASSPKRESSRPATLRS